MKRIILSIFLISPVSFGQSDSAAYLLYTFSDDSLAVNNLPYSFAGFEKGHFYIGDSLIHFPGKDSVKNFAENIKISGPFNLSEADFSESSFILVSYYGVDCHSQFKVRFSENPELKAHEFSVTVISGGCRAGGRHFCYWLKIPKLPEGYTINFLKTAGKNKRQE